MPYAPRHTPRHGYFNAIYGHPQVNTTNLNRTYIPVDGNYADVLTDLPHRANPTTVGDVTILFYELAAHLCVEIERWPCVVGCMAWLTNEIILDTLRNREVSLIVQKEDWLRPDSGNYTHARLRQQYDMLRPVDAFGHDLDYNVSSPEDRFAPVMCAGVSNTRRMAASPRMHHKFMVFGDYVRNENPDIYDRTFVPRAVWTGSFNATYNGTQSIENAVLIRNEEIARAYYVEWKTILGISEPLNWFHEWVAPVYRVGT